MILWNNNPIMKRLDFDQPNPYRININSIKVFFNENVRFSLTISHFSVCPAPYLVGKTTAKFGRFNKSKKKIC